MRKLHLIGFGSQGQAWAQNLRDSGWEVLVYLNYQGVPTSSPSSVRAQDLGFKVWPLSALPAALNPHTENLVAALIPDHKIGSVYRQVLAPSAAPVTLILAHGYAVYSGDLDNFPPHHHVSLLAPKAIGPELRRHFVVARNSGQPAHQLTAAITKHTMQNGTASDFASLAAGLGFAKERLVETSPETEAVGDLLSEQGLLCGGLFTLIDWTMSAMEEAQIPGRLIREECVTELLLIANLIKERGLEATLSSISQAARAGAAQMNAALESSDAHKAFQSVLLRVLNKEFINDFDSRTWTPQAEALARRFRAHDKHLSAKFEGGPQ